MKRSKAVQFQHKSRPTKRTIYAISGALAVASLSLTGCDSSNAKLYKTVERCEKDAPDVAVSCVKAFDDAKEKAQKTAPRFNDLASCQAEFGKENCEKLDEKLFRPRIDSLSRVIELYFESPRFATKIACAKVYPPTHCFKEGDGTYSASHIAQGHFVSKIAFDCKSSSLGEPPDCNYKKPIDPKTLLTYTPTYHTKSACEEKFTEGACDETYRYIPKMNYVLLQTEPKNSDYSEPLFTLNSGEIASADGYYVANSSGMSGSRPHSVELTDSAFTRTIPAGSVYATTQDAQGFSRGGFGRSVRHQASIRYSRSSSRGGIRFGG